MVEVMKIMVTSFKRPHAFTASLSAPNPAEGHSQPMPQPEAPGHSQASLGQSQINGRLFNQILLLTAFQIETRNSRLAHASGKNAPRNLLEMISDR